MSPNDWQDALRSLLPDGYTPEPEEPEKVKDEKKPVLTVTLDRKRAGKTATIIYGFDPDDSRCAQLAVELRHALATGGSARDGEILLQGDRLSQVRKFLTDKGYKVKNA